MPYIGNTIRAADDYRLIDDISSSFNGSTTSFALQVAGSAPVPFPKSPQQVLISVNGVIQEPDPTGASGFNLVGTNIVFSSAPTNGHAFFGIIYATADYLNAGGNFPAGSLGAPSITFIGDENTGLFRKSGGSVGFVSDATEIANFDSNGITISSGNIIIPDSIIHGGDSDTKIRFSSANTVSVETGGTERLKILNNSIIINETGADFDIRIEGDAATNLVRIDAGNDKVGINTSAPEEKLHVGGAIVATGTNNTSSTAGSNRSILDFTSGGTRIGHFRGTTSAGSGSLKFFVDSSEKMVIDSSGNVGIGTNSPSSLLHVDGDVTIKDASPSILFSDDSGVPQNPDYKIQVNTGNFVINDDTNSATRLLIDSSGNVGIAKSTPDSLLHLQKSGTNQSILKLEADLGSNNNRSLIFKSPSSDSSSAPFRLATANSIAFEIDDTERLRINSNGDIFTSGDQQRDNAKLTVTSNSTGVSSILAIHNSNGDGTAAKIGSTKGLVLAADVENNSPADKSFIMFECDDSEKARILSDGKIGISTSTPQVTLDVGGSSSGGLNGLTNPVLYAGFTNNTNFGGVVLGAGANGNTPFIAASKKSDGNALPLDLITNGTNTVRIDTSGRVGIGTVSPDSNLHAHKNSAGSASSDGNAVITAENNTHCIFQMLSPNNVSNRIMFGDPDDANAGEIQYNHNNNDLSISTAGSERARLTSVGRFGIGTSAPDTSLHVIGNATFSTNSSSNNIQLRTTVNNGNDSQFRFEKARGGTGTASIVQDNDDLGEIQFRGYDGNSYDVGARILAEVEGSPADGNIPTRFAFQTRADGGSITTRMHIGSNGRVGIATESPSEQLHVLGNILASGTITPNSDIAFKKDIEPLTNVLNRVKQLFGVNFRYKDNNEKSMGLLAQDVEKVFPELIKGEEGEKSLNYMGLTGAIVEAIKELADKVAVLEAS